MCGIAAIVDSTGQQVAGRLAEAVRQLRHRGPDGSALWLGPDGAVGLGHTRLSVIDLQHGQQPLQNESGTIWASVNGEFYGADEIRARLETQGHCFRTRSDSEIVVHLYEDIGTECVHQLRGEFAFALWDASRARLWAGRDRFGVKPLFYASIGGVLALASEAKSLLAIGVERVWDVPSVLEQLFFFVRQDRTLFRGVQQVPPGHYLLHTEGVSTIHKYWDLDYPEAAELTAGAAADRTDQFRDALSEAVAIRLRADVPLTIFLSGGLDSSSVLALASRHLTHAPSALHVSFPRTDYDESALARCAAAAVGAPLHVLELDEPTLVKHFPDAVWHGEMLTFNAHAVARFLQSRAARQYGYKVALTGEGADETLGGYPGFRPDATREDSQRAGRRGAAARVLHERLGYSPAWIDRIHAERAPFYALLTPTLTDSVDFDGMCEAFVDQFDLRGQLRGRHPLQQSMYLWMKSVLPNYTLCADRLDMAHGIETRPPFLDHRLWEITRTLPCDSLIDGHEEKRVLRRACAGLLPEPVRSRTKHSFTAPPISGGGPLREFANDELRSSAFQSVPFFDHRAVTSLLDLLGDRPAAGVDSVLMLLLSVHLLNKSYALS